MGSGAMDEEDHAGFEAFYRTEHARLVGLLTVALRDVDQAAEVCAEAFARAWERWDRLVEYEQPAGWVYRVAINAARRHARRRALEQRLLRRLAPAQVLYPAEPIDPRLWAALQTLTFRQRSVVALRHVVGLSQNEVADVLGIRPGTVSATLVTARRKLIAALGPTIDQPEPRHA
jgi:RNA polymerase sigma-70 factor (ECF subfamily)